MSKINLRRLEVFQTVYQLGSVSAAAKALHVTQPSVSRMIKDFELDLGFKLFYLEKGKLRPSPEADKIYRQGQPLFEHAAQLERLSQQLRGGDEGLLRLAGFSGLCLDLIPAASLEFAQRFPKAQINLSNKTLAEQQAALSNGSIDLAIGPSSSKDEGFSYQHLGQGQMVCLVPRQHPLADKACISESQFLQHYQIGSDTHRPIVQSLFQQFEQLKDVQPSLLASSSLIAASLACKGNMITLCDCFTAEHFRHRALIKPMQKPLFFEIYGFYLSLRPPSHLQSQFMDLMAMRIKEFGQDKMA